MIGIYLEDKIVEKLSIDGQTSDVLPEALLKILQKYDIDKIFYANGPGSFMSIKICFVILQTLSITKNIPLFATDGFYFNQNSPIKAFGNVVFVKKDGKITTFKNYDGEIAGFSLPENLNSAHFSKNVEPLYILPAV